MKVLVIKINFKNGMTIDGIIYITLNRHFWENYEPVLLRRLMANNYVSSQQVNEFKNMTYISRT